MNIAAKFQASIFIMLREIARTDTPTDRPTEKIQKLNNPIFGFGQITGLRHSHITL